MKRITIYDVANEANVSLATVSRVINGSDVVREDTRVKVQEAIEKLGYKPNAIAQGLALQKTTTVALIVPDASFLYTGQVIGGLIDVAKIYKYNMTLHTATEGITEMNDIIESIIKSRADGVVILNDKLDREELDTLTKYETPIVVIGNRMAEDVIGSVYVDYSKLAYETTKEYLDKGLSKIALVEDRKNPAMIAMMDKGMKKAYKEAGISYDYFIKIPTDYRSSYTYLKDVITKESHPEVVLAYRDSQAIATLNVAKEAGINVPDEMELICVLDSKYNSMMRPEISGFKIPDYDQGAVAMRLLTKLLHDETENIDKEIELSYIFNKRGSTK